MDLTLDELKRVEATPLDIRRAETYVRRLALQPVLKSLENTEPFNAEV